MDVNGFSLESVFQLRAKAIAEIRQHTTAIARLAAALADLDAAMTCCIDERSIDEMQNLITAARLLSDAMDGRAV